MGSNKTEEYNFDGLEGQQVQVEGEFVYFKKRSTMINLVTGRHFYVEPSEAMLSDLKNQTIDNYQKHGVIILCRPMILYGVVEPLNSINILTIKFHEIII